jgi:hypothetical protein
MREKTNCGKGGQKKKENRISLGKKINSKDHHIWI